MLGCPMSIEFSGGGPKPVIGTALVRQIQRIFLYCRKCSVLFNYPPRPVERAKAPHNMQFSGQIGFGKLKSF